MTAKILFLVFLVELCDAVAHILFKKSANRLGTDNLNGIKSYLSFFWNVLRSPAIWCGFLLIASGLIIWLTVLAQVELSVAFPIGSMRYLLIMAASYLFLEERFDTLRIIGTLCIVAGIACVALS